MKNDYKLWLGVALLAVAGYMVWKKSKEEKKP